MLLRSADRRSAEHQRVLSQSTQTPPVVLIQMKIIALERDQSPPPNRTPMNCTSKLVLTQGLEAVRQQFKIGDADLWKRCVDFCFPNLESRVCWLHNNLSIFRPLRLLKWLRLNEPTCDRCCCSCCHHGLPAPHPLPLHKKLLTCQSNAGHVLITLQANDTPALITWCRRSVDVDNRPCFVFSRALLLARSDSTSHSAMSSVQWSVYPWQDPLYWIDYPLLTQYS